MTLDAAIVSILVGGVVAIVTTYLKTRPNRGAEQRADIDRMAAERDTAIDARDTAHARADRLAAELEGSRRDERLAQEEMSRLRRRLHDAGIDPAG